MFLTETATVADVVLPACNAYEKNGTFTNLQEREQRINEAYPPKGQAAADMEIFRRVGAKLFPDAPEFRSAATEELEPAQAVGT